MTSYTETEIDFIAGMLRDGASASQIAAHFEGRSRNAIVGIVQRNARLKAIGFRNKPNGHRGGRPKKAGTVMPPRGVKTNARLPGVPASPKSPAPYQLPGRLAVRASEFSPVADTFFRFRTTAPRRPAWDGIEPHTVGMRFLDCLPDANHPARCRVPLDLTTGGDTGPDMLVCGEMVEPGRSSCPRCQSRLFDRSRERKAA